MKEAGEHLPSSACPSPATSKKDLPSDASLFGKGRYKFWALAVILLLAFWSMLTGSVSLKWSTDSPDRFPDDSLYFPVLDALEMEEREKAVRHMWDVYAHGRRARLPKFWQESFEAAYEDLAGDDPDVRDLAVAEIARMSVRMLDLEPPPAARKPSDAGEKDRRAEVKMRGSLSSI